MENTLKNKSASIRYQRHKESLVRQYESVSRIVKVNDYLKQFNWMFVHPYNTGIQIHHLQELQKKGVQDRKLIFRFFAADFLNLNQTVSFIEGYFKKRPPLAPFCMLIDQSVILCLQKDYAGAINTLMPVIEGSIRHYLVHQKGKKSEKIIALSSFIGAFDLLKKDYLENRRKVYEREDEIFRDGILLDNNQIKSLLNYEDQILSIWLDAIKEYLSKSLYLDTRKEEVYDKLNRHDIFHGFNSNAYYNLENYLKVFNCITFLSFLFGLAYPGLSALPEFEEKEHREKVKNLEKIRAISKLSYRIKSSIYSGYPEFSKDDFEQTIFTSQLEEAIDKVPTLGVEQKLLFIEYALNGDKEEASKYKDKEMMSWFHNFMKFIKSSLQS